MGYQFWIEEELDSALQPSVGAPDTEATAEFASRYERVCGRELPLEIRAVLGVINGISDSDGDVTVLWPVAQWTFVRPWARPGRGWNDAGREDPGELFIGGCDGHESSVLLGEAGGDFTRAGIVFVDIKGCLIWDEPNFGALLHKFLE